MERNFRRNTPRGEPLLVPRSVPNRKYSLVQIQPISPHSKYIHTCPRTVHDRKIGILGGHIGRLISDTSTAFDRVSFYKEQVI